MHKSSSGNSLAYQFAWLQSQGRRARQEDYCVTLPDAAAGSAGGADEQRNVLVALADGMGGHTSGQVASRTVCDNFVGAYQAEKGSVGARLAAALDQSNSALARAIEDDASLAGMGSTIVATHLAPDGVRWVSVGDSTLMLYRDGILQRLNADHSHGAILDQQVAAGIISEEIARSDGRRRALHSALTGDPIPMQDLELDPQPLAPGDWIIAASDGLLTLSGDEIATLVHDLASGPPHALVEALIAAVAAEGEPNQDNTTIAAIRVVAAEDTGEDEDEDPATETADGEGQVSEALPSTRILTSPKGQTASMKTIAAAPEETRGSPVTLLAILVTAALLAGAVWMLTGR